MNDSLFTPLQLGAYTLRNRIVMAPLTRMRSDKQFAPTDLNAEYYRQRASAGLIITEASQISQQGQGYPFTPGIYNESQIKGWQKVTEAVHEQNGIIFLQLWHVGRISHPSHQPEQGLPVSASAIKPNGGTISATWEQVSFVEPRSLETDEIKELVKMYKQAALNAKLAGFDGVELHAANGYLIQQFLMPKTNHRTDEYGGSIENNARFLFEALEAIIEVWGADKVGIRISPLGKTNDSYDPDSFPVFDYVINKLNDYNLAYLHLIRARPEDMKDHPYLSQESNLWQQYKGTLILADGFTGDEAHKFVKNNMADAIAFGRLFISNPDLPERIANGTKLNPFDRNTFYGGNEKGYTDYPSLKASLVNAG